MVEYIKAAVFFAAGIYLYERISPGFALIFILSLIMVLTVQAIFKHKFNIKILSMALIFTAGVFLCRYAVCKDVRALSDYEGRYVCLTGRICSLPQQDGENFRYAVDVREVMHNGDTRDIKDKVLLTSPSGYEYGDTVTFEGFVEELPAVMNEGGADFARYYKKLGIFFKIYSDEMTAVDMKIADYSPYALNLRLKKYISDLIDNHYSGDYNAIMKAVLTGNKSEFSESFDKVLDRTGSSRFFYPAFLHVMLLMALLSVVLSAFKREKRDIAAIFLLIIYAAANCTSSVFVKLCILVIAMRFSQLRFGRMYYPDILGITAIIMGVINPLYYYDAAFVLSMLSSVMIYYFYDYVSAKIEFIRIKYVRRLVSIGIICTVGLIPIAAYFFNYVALHSILLSVLMLPCVTVILVLSPLLIIMLALFGTAPIVGQITAFMLFLLKRAPIAADKIFGEGLTIAEPGILLLIIYAFVVIAAVKYVKNKKSHALAAILTAAALTVSSLICEAERFNDLEITFVNVGQGDGAIISAPHRFNVLIDGGGGNAYSDYNPGETIYLEYLKTKGIRKIDSAFVSHYHKDHVQGIIAAIENLRVRNLFLPDVMEGNEWREAIERAALENGTKVHYISQETLLTYNNGMTIRILPPARVTGLSNDENDTTYLYYVDYGEFSAAFTGDMTSFAERNLIDAGKARNAELLKVAHHGSKKSTSSEWLAATKPRYAVISVGEDNTYALPNDETLERLKDTELYRTDYDGDIRFSAEKDGSVKINTLNRR